LPKNGEFDSSGTKEKRNPEIGDQWIFVALDADTKLVPTYLVGKRNSRSTYEFVKELALRVKNHFQLSTDAFPPYLDAVDRVFGAQIDYAQLHKRYGYDSEAETRYSPAKIIGINITPRIGKPAHKHISTSFVERQNLTMRMSMRRFTRLTNTFSKKLENLKAAVDLHFFYYNFMRIHKTIKVTPAMEAGVSNHLWSWEELLDFEQMKMAA